VYLSTFLASDMHRFSLLAFAGWLSHGGNKFFRGGPNISEKLVPGGTNFRGVQIKRDKAIPHGSCLVFIGASVSEPHTSEQCGKKIIGASLSDE